MSEMELQASAAFACELERSLALQGLVAAAGYDVARQLWMLGWGQGRLSAFQQALAMTEVTSALRN
jgi:hypothetical protein